MLVVMVCSKDTAALVLRLAASRQAGFLASHAGEAGASSRMQLAAKARPPMLAATSSGNGISPWGGCLRARRVYLSAW